MPRIASHVSCCVTRVTFACDAPRAVHRTAHVCRAVWRVPPCPVGQALLSLANTLGDLFRKREAMVIGARDAAHGAELHALAEQSIATYRRLLEVDPSDGDALANLLWSQKYSCMWGGFEESVARLTELCERQLSKGEVCG